MSPRKRLAPCASRWTATPFLVVLVGLAVGWAARSDPAAAPGRAPADGKNEQQAGQLLVVNKSGHSLSVLDPASGDELWRVPTGRSPHEVAVAPDGGRAYVTDYGSGERPGSTVTVVDLRRAEPVDTVSLGRHTRPHGVDVAPDGERVYVTNREAGTLSEIGVSDGEVTRTLEVGRFPIRVAVLPGGEELLVSDARANEVVRVDVDAWEVAGRIPVGSAPVGIQVTPDGRHAFVANTRDDRISVLDVGRGEVVGRLTAGEELDGMAWVSGRGR